MRLLCGLRGSDPAARRELEDLRAAINLHRKEGLQHGVNDDHPAGEGARPRAMAYAERGGPADMGRVALPPAQAPQVDATAVAPAHRALYHRGDLHRVAQRGHP